MIFIHIGVRPSLLTESAWGQCKRLITLFTARREVTHPNKELRYGPSWNSHEGLFYLQRYLPINTGMKKDKQLIESLKTILASDDQVKKDRIKLLMDIGFFGLSERDKESLLNPKTTKRKKSNGTEEETDRKA